MHCSIGTERGGQYCERRQPMASAIYGPQPMPKRARQLPAASIGVLPWQQQVWLLQIEHVLAERKGPPDLLALEGFGAPALTQYSVTTPDLLRSFRKYNAGKPYH